MKKQSIVKDTESQISEFIRLFRAGVDAWIAAGEILVELVENDPHSYDYIIEKCPQLNAGVLGRFEQMGRKTLHPQLLLTASPGFARLQKLPMSLQERYIEEPVPIVIQTADGPDVILIQAKNMTRDQAAQAFAPNRLRTQGEQRAWMVDQASKAAKPVSTPIANKPWTIKGGKVIIAGVEFTRRELAGILAQMD